MKLLSATLLLVLACLAGAQPENAELRKTLQHFYDKWDRAIESGHVRNVMALIEPDFALNDAQGKRYTFGEFEDMTRDQIRARHDLNSSTTVLNVRQQASEAIAWVKNVQTWQGNMVKTTFIAQTFRKTPEGWKVYYQQILPDNETWGPPPAKR